MAMSSLRFIYLNEIFQPLSFFHNVWMKNEKKKKKKNQMGQNSKDHILNLPFVIPLVEDEKFVPNGGKLRYKQN